MRPRPAVPRPEERPSRCCRMRLIRAPTTRGTIVVQRLWRNQPHSCATRAIDHVPVSSGHSSVTADRGLIAARQRSACREARAGQPYLRAGERLRDRAAILRRLRLLPNLCSSMPGTSPSVPSSMSGMTSALPLLDMHVRRRGDPVWRMSRTGEPMRERHGEAPGVRRDVNSSGLVPLPVQTARKSR